MQGVQKEDICLKRISKQDKKVNINDNNNIHLIPNTVNNYNKNYNIANTFWQNPRWHVFCCECKMALRPLPINNGAILPHVDYGATVRLEITYIGEVPWAYLTVTFITAQSFGFVLKK